MSAQQEPTKEHIMRYSRRQATQTEINRYVAQFAREVMDLPFRVAPNGHGHRAECVICHWSRVNMMVTEGQKHAATH